MSYEEVIARVMRVASIVELDAKNQDNKERMKEIINLARILKFQTNEVQQELNDLKEWVAQYIEMSQDDFDKYWRQQRVNFYK
jgi:hypothetical protein